MATELGYLVDESGCQAVGFAETSQDAITLVGQLQPDLVLVDVHLQDGPTGIDVARRITAQGACVALFMTANVMRLPTDFAGACGVVGKPYSGNAVRAALQYLDVCLRDGHAPGLPPVGLQLAPVWAHRWGLDDTPLSA